MKKSGFTLIELLAVIVILAVIAIISTPIVLNVVENAQKRADLGSANGLIDAGRLYYSESLLDEQKKENLEKYNNLWNEVVVQGEKPKEGYLYVNPKGEIALSVIYRNTCYQKEFETGIQILKEADCGLGFVGIDTIPPKIVYTTMPISANEHGWFQEDFYVSIEVIDQESGGASYKWCQTKGENCEPLVEQLGKQGTVLIELESARNRVCVIGYDLKGNASEVICSDPYRLDKTAPTFSGIGDIIIKKDESVDLLKEVVVEDNFSGIDGSFTYAPTSIDTSKSGITNVIYRVKDLAGNEKEVLRKVIVEAEAPTVTFTPETGKINSNGWAKEDFLVTINPVDQSGHGIKEYKWCSTTSSSCDPSGNIAQTSEKGAMTISTESASNRICVIATDNTGTSSTNICSDSYKLDKTAPTFQGVGNLSVTVGGSVNLTNGVSVSDSLSGMNGTYTYNPTSVSTSSTGNQIVTYEATDFAGNKTSIGRTITVSGYQWQKYNAIGSTYYYWNRFNIKTTITNPTMHYTGQRYAFNFSTLTTFFYNITIAYDTSGDPYLMGKQTGTALNNREYCTQGHWSSIPYYCSGKNCSIFVICQDTTAIFERLEVTGTETKTKGSSSGMVASASSSSYPNDGISGSYWYVYSYSDILYSQGSSYYGTVTSSSSSSYPTNGRHSDGYWYVRI